MSGPAPSDLRLAPPRGPSASSIDRQHVQDLAERFKSPASEVVCDAPGIGDDVSVDEMQGLEDVVRRV